jgi:2-keto-4-pentenoate hydratase/2-oxohepta-3-ene-1,7-dioic acid hydratase in catechol pathway
MKIAQFEVRNHSLVGIEVDGVWIDYGKAAAAYNLLERNVAMMPRPTIAMLLVRGEFSVAEFRAVGLFVKKHRLLRLLRVPGNARLRAPVSHPGKIVALGLNYALHVAESSFKVPKEPVIFMKAGSSVVGPGDTVRIPRGLGRMDHEVELAVVIGRRATNVPKRKAFAYVAGYTICNDVTARSIQTADINNRHPWFRSKSFDTFTPMGPWIVTPDEITPPVHLAVECRVNGKLRQKSNTRHLVFDIPTIIEFVSRYITLEPGDIISTGTPEGIGPIKNGDTIVCRIDKIGELKNPVKNR